MTSPFIFSFVLILFPFNFVVKRYIRKGIPRDFRAEVWLSVSGAKRKMVNKPKHYEEMLKKANDPDVLQRIELGKNRVS